MTISENVKNCLSASSWIRRMFEEGAVLKARHGADKVFDFSLGNPNLRPPEKFQTALRAVAMDPDLNHAYMPNSGYPETRRAVADQVGKEQQTPLSENEIIMTCGAAGGLNVVLKALLNPGETVVVPAPFFVEYKFYAENHGGRLVTAPCRPDFDLDPEALAKALTPETRAVIINSPNNPTGAVYPAATLDQLGRLLAEKSREYGRTIYLIADEPYRKIVYDGIEVPPVFTAYADSLVVTSYSKDLSLPGERIGFIAVNPQATYKDELLAAMTFANRVLGFVNAPAFMQRVIAEVQGERVDVGAYARKRDLLCDILSSCGYSFIKPAGAFYLFPRSPLADDIAFVRTLQQSLILAVPGSGFGGPGYFRISYCVADRTIINSADGFKQAFSEAVKV